MQGTRGVFEMTWAPDGRATFSYGEPVQEGARHVQWRRCGTHSIFRNPRKSLNGDSATQDSASWSARFLIAWGLRRVRQWSAGETTGCPAGNVSKGPFAWLKARRATITAGSAEHGSSTRSYADSSPP